MSTKAIINIKTTVNAPISKVWDYFTYPEDVMNWNFASGDWHCPKADNTFEVGGKFNYRMEAKDGSFGFDLTGTFVAINEHELLVYKLDDNRMVSVNFIDNGLSVEVQQSFEAEEQNSLELQENGWLAILNNFKKYCENN